MKIISRCVVLLIVILFIRVPIHEFIGYSAAEKLETGFYLPLRDLGGYLQFGCVKWDMEGNCISYHLGVDLNAPEGDPVYAVADGKIEWQSDDVCGFLAVNPTLPGGAMVIKHESTEGTFYALYGHIKNQEIRDVHIFQQRSFLTMEVAWPRIFFDDLSSGQTSYYQFPLKGRQEVLLLTNNS